MHPKFDLPGFQAHDLKIMNSTFHVPETVILTCEPSGTFSYCAYFSYQCEITYDRENTF